MLLAVKVVAVVAASALALAACGTGGQADMVGGEQPPGFRATNPNGLAQSQPLGWVFTYGLTVLRTAGDGDVKLLSIKPELEGSGLAYLGARVAGPSRYQPGAGFGQVSTADGFPPRPEDLGPGDAVEGFVARDDAGGRSLGYELFLGYRVVGDGGRQAAIALEYEIGRARHRVRLPSELVICAQPKGEPCAND
jgi:hypothetical protein